jgi:hypothetical protein
MATAFGHQRCLPHPGDPERAIPDYTGDQMSPDANFFAHRGEAYRAQGDNDRAIMVQSRARAQCEIRIHPRRRGVAYADKKITTAPLSPILTPQSVEPKSRWR